MHLSRFRVRALREWVVLLLLPAVAFRLLVPAGFMPDFGEGVTVTMQMCQGDPLSSIVVRLTGEHGSSGHGGNVHEAPCLFAASATASVTPAGAPTVPVVDVPDAPPLPRATAIHRSDTHRPQSPRAPPSLI